MKERPLLFSGPMVRGLLAGTKTQTRRLPKYPLNAPEGDWYADRYNKTDEWCFWERVDGQDTGRCTTPLFKNPKAEVGEVIWVRETTRVLGWGHLGEVRLEYAADGAVLERQIPIFGEDSWMWERWNNRMCELSERLGGKYVSDGNINLPDGVQFPRTPSILMPRWACRLRLEVTDVRLERLQDISEADAQAEGAVQRSEMWPAQPELNGTYRLGFRHLWESINGKENWQANPWVWVYTFKAVSV